MTVARKIAAEYCEIQLDPQLLVEKAQELDLVVNQYGVEVQPVMAKQDLQLEYLCRSMIVELQEGGVSGRLYFDQLVSLLAFRILKHYSTTNANFSAVPLRGMNHQIKRALELIHDCSEKDLTLKGNRQRSEYEHLPFFAYFQAGDWLDPASICFETAGAKSRATAIANGSEDFRHRSGNRVFKHQSTE